MPLNLLKLYPELLEINHLEEKNRNISLKRIFDRDIAENENFFYNGGRIYPIKSDDQIDMDREFHHLITEEVEETDENGKKIHHRIYDPYRSERLHWIKPHINKEVNDSNIIVFSIKERNQRKRVDIVRTYIYNKTRKYVIVLEPQARNGKAYYLLTAYYLNKNYGEKQIQKKLKAKLLDVL